MPKKSRGPRFSLPGWAAAAALFLVAIVFGGGTYQRSWPDAVVQLASLPLLAMALWKLPSRWSEPGIRVALTIAVGVAALPLLQLVPLPPSLWTNLPGREPIAASFRELNIKALWFPISLSPAETWRSALGLLPPLAMFLTTLSLTQKDRRAMTLILICLGFLSVVVGLAQIAAGAEGPFRFYGARLAAVGYFANQNHYAALLYTMIPLTAAWAVGLAADRRPELIVASLLCLLFFASLLLGLGMAQSRAGLALAVGGSFASMALMRIGGGGRAPAMGRSLLLVAGFVGALLVVQFASVGILQQLEADPLADDRWTISSVTLEAAKDFLPFGSGFGTFDSVYKMYESVGMLEQTYVNNAHNDFAEVFLEGGLAAAVLFAGFLGWFIFAATRIWRMSAGPNSRALDISLSRAASICIVLLVAHSAVDYPLRSAALSTLFAFSCALMLPPPRVPSNRYSRGGARTHGAAAAADLASNSRTTVTGSRAGAASGASGRAVD